MIITFLLFLVPIALIEPHKKNKFSQIITNQFVKAEKNNLYVLGLLFESNKGKEIDMKHYGEEGNLLSQKKYCSSDENFSLKF